MEIIFNGLLSGIILAFLIGPVFFTIIQTSVEKGFTHGALVAAGVSISDATCISLIYFGLSHVIQNPHFELYLAYAGGIILIAFGGYYLFIKSRKLNYFNPHKIEPANPLRYIAKGFIINGLSPMVFIFWIGTLGVATTELGYHQTHEIVLYFSAIVGTVFITDVLKAKLADKLRMALTPKFIRGMNIVLGILMVIFGGRLFFHAQHLIL